MGRHKNLVLRGALITCGFLLTMTAVAQANIEVPDEFAASTIAVGLVDGRDIVATDDGRIFVALGGGDIRVIKNDSLLDTPLLSIPVDNRAQEGLHSLALDENFDQNGFLYAVFTPRGVDVSRLSRFTVNGDRATLGSEQIIYDGPALAGATSHYGAAVVDNGDGTLLLTIGDHTRSRNGQDRGSEEGSLLRINKNGTIPGDNPYINNGNFEDAIYAYGFRNPWQIARSADGQIAVSDVGGSLFEELNLVSRAGNYGWDEAEGVGNVGEDPLFTYPHFGLVGGAEFEGCAVTGSTFYEPDVVQLPSRFVGDLFVGDFCAGWIAAVDPESGDAEQFATGFDAIADLATNPANGALYVLDRNLANGRSGVSKIEFVGPNATLRVTSQPETQNLAIGQTASFFVAANGQGDITYQWQRNGANIPGATSPLLEIAGIRAADDGAQFRVRVSDDVQTVTSSIAELLVSSNNAPAPRITSPDVGSTYGGGDQITIRGTASDVEDGTLGNSSLSWEVRLNHDDHDHGFTGEISGTNQITIQIPRNEETSGNVWYTVYLTATDSDGASTTTTQRINPRQIDFLLNTSPRGGVINLDGPPVPTPFSTVGVEGIERTVRASLTQEIAGTPSGFVSWSNGGDIAQSVQPTGDLSLQANYAALPFGPANGGPTCRTVRIEDAFVTTFAGDLGSSVNLLRGTRWIQNVTGFDVYVDADDPGPNSTYTARVRTPNGTSDIRCSVEAWPPPGNPTPPPPPPPAGDGPACTGVQNGNTVTLTFDADGASSANLLRNGSWRANVSGDTTFTDNSAANSYTLRTRAAGVTTDTPCTFGDDTPPPPADGPACTGVQNGNTVTLTFDADGASSANLLRNGSWRANVSGDTTFTDNSAANSYTLRTRAAGVTIDTTCTIG